MQMSERSELHISGRVKKSKDFSIFSIKLHVRQAQSEAVINMKI